MMRGVKSTGSSAVPGTNLPSHIKPFPRTQKALTEHKMKRLNILTFINDKKEILFTKKAFKHEKERIWRQIFQKMLEFGMVSKEKDWRYVRDVSFSNWRKRAQKRLKHLAANGYRLNMDECEFLIYDILGKTPDKLTNGQLDHHAANAATMLSSGDSWMSPEGDLDPMDEDESDEYMIDSDEDDDDDDASFDEMSLFVPKIVFNDNLSNEENFEQQGHSATQGMSHKSSGGCGKSSETSIKNDSEQGSVKQEMEPIGRPQLSKNGGSHSVNGTNNSNGNNCHRMVTYVGKSYSQNSHQSNLDHVTKIETNRSNLNAKFGSPKPLNESTELGNNNNNNEQENMEQSSSSPNRYMNKFRELRLLDLEIENKVLKNRYMKLKIYELEQNLGLEHCKEVKEIVDEPALSLPSPVSGGKGTGSIVGQFKSTSNQQIVYNSKQQQQQQQQQQQSQQHEQLSNSESMNSHKMTNMVTVKVGGNKMRA